MRESLYGIRREKDVGGKRDGHFMAFVENSCSRHGMGAQPLLIGGCKEFLAVCYVRTEIGRSCVVFFERHGSAVVSF